MDYVTGGGQHTHFQQDSQEREGKCCGVPDSPQSKPQHIEPWPGLLVLKGPFHDRGSKLLECSSQQPYSAADGKASHCPKSLIFQGI